MKKLLSLLAILSVAMTAVADGTWTDADGIVWQKVSTPEAFKTAVIANQNVLVTEDIDISKVEVANKNCNLVFASDFVFNGRISGTYIDSKGDTIVSALKNIESPLFLNIKDATISGIVFKDSKINDFVLSTDTHSAGLVTCFASNSHYSDIILENCTSVNNDSDHHPRVGLLAGYAGNCTFDNIKAFNCEVTTGGSMIGVLVGKAYNSTFDQCSTNLQCGIWAKGVSFFGADGNAYAGGLCGYAQNTSFAHCHNLALVCGEDDRIGGFIGYGDNVTFTDCVNYGVVRHVSEDGYKTMKESLRQVAIEVQRNIHVAYTTHNLFIAASLGLGSGTIALIGSSLLYSSITNILGATSFSILLPGAIFAWSTTLMAYLVGASNYVPDEAGGIAGCIENNSKIIRCTNRGYIECYDAYCGGIVGYAANSNIEACINQGRITAQEQVGGIVGYFENSTVRYNINLGVVKGDESTVGMINGEKSGDVKTYKDNYYLSDVECQSQADIGAIQEQFASGYVTLRINEEISRDVNKDSIVYRQNLGTHIFPVLDTDAQVVTATTNNYNLWYKVSNAAQLMEALTNYAAKIELTADIDLTGYALPRVGSALCPFSGEIKGNGHTIYNCNSVVELNLTKGEEKASAAGLISYAEGAKFEDIKLANIHITQRSETWGRTAQNTEAFLVASSEGCTYKKITVTNCSITRTGKDGDYLYLVGGIVANSTNDSFDSCTIGKGCKLEAYLGWAVASDCNLGGIAGKAVGSTFTMCSSAAELWADDNNDGGIVGYAENCTIDRCLNTGHITAQEKVGGICGYGKNTLVTHCVNTGVIDDDESKREDYRAGIVGYLDGSNASVTYCINYGSVNHATESTCSPINNKREDGASYGDRNQFYCQFNGVHTNDVYTGEETYNNMLIGEFALNMTDGAGNHWLYQSIDNDIDFPTNMPVPIPAAGKVYSNILCDGTQSYSNIYHSTAVHTGTADAYGKCTTCGRFIGTLSTEVHVSDADDLIELARNVNNGVDFSGVTVYLDNDIDMGGYNYTPIGNGFATPYRGIFDGQGNRIKNVVAYSTQNCLGIFGCVAGTTTIKNLIVDSSCLFVGTGYGVAGIVGCLARQEEGLSNVISLTLHACGNEANVTGDINAAGLVGGVYNTETNGNAEVNIINCYNTGNIIGTRESAALLAYGNGTVLVSDSYNTGKIDGYDLGHSLVRYNSAVTPDIDNVYNLSSVASDVKAEATPAEDFANGKVCSLLSDDSSTPWCQNLGTDTIPALGEGGIFHKRYVYDKWGTVCLPYDIQTNDDIQLYAFKSVSIDETTGEMTFYPINDIVPANTPCVFSKKDDTATSVTFTPVNSSFSIGSNLSSATVTGWTMTGTYTNIMNMTGGYYISNNQFWYADAATKVPAFRAWFTGPTPSSNSAKAFTIQIADCDVTGISELRDGSLELKDGSLELRDGKYLEKGKVLIIKNGKKYNLNGQVIR